MVARYGTIDDNDEENDDDNFDHEDNASESNTRIAAVFNYKYILGKHSIEEVSL
jgi:hypothetical protein